MSATRRLPHISLILGVATVAVATGWKESSKYHIARGLGFDDQGALWRLIAIFLALINLKNLPFVWHFRLFRALIYQLFVQPAEIRPHDLFKPVVQATHTPVSEMDYNFHKSNSTYFTDLDIARTHLATAILRKGLRGVKDEKKQTFSFRNTSRAAGHRGASQNSSSRSTGDTSLSEPKAITEKEWYEQVVHPGPLLIALGAVTCNFHREIKPYHGYEIWTRLLTWDRKWLYIVSHFVEKDVFTPSGYSLQKGRRVSKGIGSLSEEDRLQLKKKIFASSMAKYVVKKGRLTIPPELVLERSQMLPTRPNGVPILGGWTPSSSSVPSVQQTASPSPQHPSLTPRENGPEDGNPFQKQNMLTESMFLGQKLDQSADEMWTWENMEQTRLKGLQLATAFDSLDGLKDIFNLDGELVLGHYTDLFFNM